MTLFDAVNEVIKSLTEAHRQIASLQWSKDHSVVHGRVSDVDAKKHRCRLIIGTDEDGKDVKSPWVPYSQIAGTRKVHSAPSKGQQMTIMAPNGDYSQSLAFPLTWWNENPSPSEDGAEDIDLRGRTRRTQRDADLKQEVDGMTVHHTKQSHKVTIHKDAQAEEVSDAKPWKGNRVGSKHQRHFNKEDGYALTINDGEQSSEHKIIAHPDGRIEHSVFNERNKTTIDDENIRHSVDNKSHYVDIKNGEGIKLKTESRISQEAASEIVDTAPMIHHHGLTDIFGTLNIGGNLEWLQNLAQTIMGGATPGQDQQFQPGATGGNLNVFGITNLGSALNVAGMASLGGGLNVSGDASLSGGLSAFADASFGGPLSVDGAVSLNSGANISGDTSLAGDISVAGVSSLGLLNVSGSANFSDDIAVQGATALESLNVNDSAVFAGDVTVDGNCAFDDVNVTGALTIAGPTTLNGGFSGGALTVAKTADGGLTHATMGFQVTGKVVLSLQNFANDAAAAAGGIAVGQLYRNGSVVMVRVV